jgi:hypothetical protein
MARVTYVKHARQRYAMVPDIDPATGEQKVVPVMRADGVTPKKTKTGREVTRRLTVQDRSQPLPNLRCDFPGCDIDGGEILPGTSYKHITPRSGPYGGTQKNRHAAHPSWQVWDYSFSVRAQAARVQHDMEGEIDSYEFGSTDDFDDLKQSLVDQANDFLSEREDTLSNLPEQLQDSSISQEYVEAAEQWVSALEDVDAPDGDALEDCEACDGTGEVESDRWYANGPDSQSLNEEGYDSEGEAQADLDAYLAEHEDESEDDWTVEQGDSEECEECDGGKTDVIGEEWAEEAKGLLRDAVYELGI